MSKVISNDSTTIAFDQSGQGPVVILVPSALSDRSNTTQLAALLSPHFTVVNYDRRGRGESSDTKPYAVECEIEDIAALIDEAGGSAFIFGHSSGAVLALEATSKLPTRIKKQALFEPPFIVDNSRPPVPSDFATHAAELVSAGRRGDAVEFFMISAVGVPAELVAQMKESPMWAGLEAVAHTLAYDGTIMGDTQSGKPLPAQRWATVTAPTLVMDGGESPAWLHNAAQALADILPNAQHRTLKGQDHSVAITAPGVLAPILIEFFTTV